MTTSKTLAIVITLVLAGLTACTVSVNMAPGSVVFYVQPQSGVWATGTPEPTPTPEAWLPTPTCTPALVPYVVKFDNVRLRSGDATTYSIAGTLDKGTRVFINFCDQEDVAEDWYRVQVPEGYIYVSLIEPSNE